MLSVEHVEVRYGAVPAIRDLSLNVNEGEIVTILGANGAGKTTTLRMISGLHRPFAGKVRLDGVDITSTPAHELVEMGLSHVPEGRRIFATMSVLENLEMGAFRRKGNYSDEFEHIFTLFPVLGERRKQLGGTLSGGEQQMLAIGRALMAKPRLLLLDEPSLGLAPKIITSIFQIIVQIRSEGVTVLLVEQNANQALRIADRGYVLENGHVLYEDNAAALLGDDRIRRAYLGSEA
ncbi:MAG TPA: ABC transporter ATP-binding protein [Acidimicrobiales bacterium]|nr:ABC transporter ATP-binding protein [Acidimicrobiales bacterium]